MQYAHQVSSLVRVKRRSGEEWSALCPFHNDTRPSLSVNVRTGLWLCHGCGERGNIEKLGGTRLDDLWSIDLSVDDGSLRFTSWSQVLDSASVGGYEEWAERGISREIVDRFGLGYREGCLVIPTLDGEIERRLRSEPKYWNEPGMRKSRMLYLAEFVDDPVVAVCEGPIDALKCWEAGVQAVSVFGTQVSYEQEVLLRELPSTVAVIMFDDDRAGRLGGARLEAVLGDRFLVCWPTWSVGSDPGDVDTSTLRGMVDDAVDSVL